MSYCVNCGVELAESEKSCPLCGVPVQNPAKPWEEPERHPYSRRIDRIAKRADKRYFLAVASLVLLIPVLVTVLTDFLTTGTLSWSGYVAGGVMLVLVLIFLPLAFEKPRPYFIIGADTLVVCLFLLFVAMKTGSRFFVPLAMPVTVTCGVLCIVCALIFRKTHIGFLVKGAIVFLFAGFYTVCIELFVDFYLRGVLLLNWSPYVMIPCAALALVLLILNKRVRFREELRRRFFI